jgi:hypothetical protein
LSQDFKALLHFRCNFSLIRNAQAKNFWPATGQLLGLCGMVSMMLGRLRSAHAVLNAVSVSLVGIVAAVLGVASLLAAFNVIPWPQLALFFGGQAVPQSGMWLQLGLTGLLLLLLLYLPANLRISRLERSHRSFAFGMHDVARAYAHAHAADRKGVFGLSSEFDDMKARLNHLREHPDLRDLEPELLQLAAQMSFETRELAQTYSDENVVRAKDFLRQRQHEVQALTDRLAAARTTCDELRRWLQDIDAEERQAQTQIKRLEADLKEILPTLGYDFDLEDHREPNVVQLPKPGK